MRGHGSQWISYKINIRHPLQLKKSKSWEPFRSYQLNSTANPAHLPQIWPDLFYMKSIETHARAILALNILGIGTVLTNEKMGMYRKLFNSENFKPFLKNRY